MAKPLQQATKADYQLLGVKPGATVDELRATYKSLVKKWHPDRFAENTPEKFQAEEKLKTINAAYSRLRSEAIAWSSQASADSTALRNRRPQQPDIPRQRQRQDQEMPPPKPAAARSREFLRRFLGNFARSEGFRNSWVRVSIALLPIMLLAMLTNDIPRLPIGDDRHPSSPTINNVTPRPVIPPSEPISRASTPTLPRQPSLPPESKPVERPAIAPAREGPRRPIGGQAGEKPRFTLGSLKHEVVRVQGKPQRVNGQTWVYGLSEVSFKEGRVWSYNNFDGSLNVELVPSAPAPADQRTLAFSIGANKDEVLYVQGTPTRVDPSKWYYGLSEVTFKDGKVVAYNNFFNALKVLVKPRGGGGPASHPKHFTIGSTQDEVLAVQGTPSSIQGNLWSYELSDVWFHEGKVRVVNDFSNVLKFQPID
jgi:hypothetical protein